MPEANVDLNTDAQEKVNVQSDASVAAQKGKKVLLVEDDKFLCDLMVRKFKDENFDVYVAMDGEEGLRSAIENKPDLILLDLVMPKMDGMAMLNKLRDDKWGNNADVIILTNLSDAEKVSEAVNHGTYEYLVKVDWDIAAVADKVRGRLGL